MSDALAMTSVLRICRKCGAKILADAPEGLCAACVLETGLGILQDNFDGEGDAGPALHIKNSRNVGCMTMPGELGGYELLEEIGRGGQGVVYRARQKGLNRTVALKIIGLGRWARKAHLKRFRLEAEAAASLDHPGIVPIYEIGESDGSCYFSMKLVEGGQLDEVIKRQPMPIRRGAELIAKLARTVHYAHQRGILHRDIKPGNILVDAEGEPHLTDFGLARLMETESTVTRTTDVLGTPSYMAPEQARGNNPQITSATDVYGLGAIFYQLLTGHPPFAGGTTYETVRLVLETDPRHPRLWNPKVDHDLATICLKCLEKEPERRYSSALALADDLQRWLRHEPILARRTGVMMRARKWLRRNPTAAVIVAALAVLSATAGMMVWQSWPSRARPTGIAVLPFENLSNAKEDASFADGLQDDILTKLAKIADLKVISRTSVMQYHDQRNTRQIGDALGVSHVLEGSVRKTGTRLHMNAQLIDTRTDTHVWAEQYDRDLKDVFAIQSEIAQKVAAQLHAKISSTEKLAIEQPPTADPTAFDLYSRARNLLLMTSFSSTAKSNLLLAAALLNQAVVHDPAFFQAQCQLAQAHAQLYFLGFDHTEERMALAEAAVATAFRLRPNAGEAHVARAENLYQGHLDYNGALAELELARPTLPNDPQLFELKGYIDRRRGRWDESTRNLERAAEIDPRNVHTLQQIALSYDHLQRYEEEKSVLNRALAIAPNDVETKVARALVEMDWKGDMRPLHEMVESVRTTNPSGLPGIADGWLICALGERNPAAARQALISLGENRFGRDVVQFNRPFVEGVIARLEKDDEKARSAFLAARTEQEKTVEAQPNYGPPLCVLGLVDAALGRKEQALREGQRAVELLPVTKDAVNGPLMVAYSAMIAAWVGDKDLACKRLSAAVRPPTSLSYGQLKLLPFWDPLRGDPRFEQIVASLAPKEGSNLRR